MPAQNGALQECKRAELPPEVTGRAAACGGLRARGAGTAAAAAAAVSWCWLYFVLTRSRRCVLRAPPPPPPPPPLSPPAGMSSSFHFSSRRRRRRRSRSRPLAAAFTAVDPAPSRHPLRTLFVFSLVSARSPYRNVNHDCPVSGTRCVTCNIIPGRLLMTPIQFLLSGSLIFHSHPVIHIVSFSPSIARDM